MLVEPFWGARSPMTMLVLASALWNPPSSQLMPELRPTQKQAGSSTGVSQAKKLASQRPCATHSQACCLETSELTALGPGPPHHHVGTTLEHPGP